MLPKSLLTRRMAASRGVLSNHATLTRQRPYSAIRAVSTCTPRHNKSANSPTNSSKKPNNQQPHQNHELPAFSLESLGISKNMRMILLVILSIFGTIETYTYYIWLRQWCYGTEKDGEDVSNKQGSFCLSR